MMAHMHVEDDGSNSSVKLVHFKWSECSEELLGDLTDTLYRNYQSLPGLTTLYLHLCLLSGVGLATQKKVTSYISFVIFHESNAVCYLKTY